MSRSPDGNDYELTVRVGDPSGVAEARRRAIAVARGLGFAEPDLGRVGLVITELATNLVKHAGSGEILLQAVCVGSEWSLEMLALDRGKGIARMAEAMRDGYSTAGSPGTGLGAIARQADLFDLYSALDAGTAVFAQVWSRSARRPVSERLSVGAACAPRTGEDVNGDGWVVTRNGSRVAILLADGLGHGPLAAEARREAIRIFRTSWPDSPARLVAAIHAGLRATRGAAVAVSEIDPEGRSVRFCGLGNIGASIVTGGNVRHLVSHNGTAGHAARKIEEFIYPWLPDSTLVKHTDGLGTQWAIERYPGLVTHHPSLLAGVLYRDFKRGRDDVAVVVAREAAA